MTHDTILILFPQCHISWRKHGGCHLFGTLIWYHNRGGDYCLIEQYHMTCKDEQISALAGLLFTIFFDYFVSLAPTQIHQAIISIPPPSTHMHSVISSSAV